MFGVIGWCSLRLDDTMGSNETVSDKTQWNDLNHGKSQMMILEKTVCQ